MVGFGFQINDLRSAQTMGLVPIARSSRSPDSPARARPYDPPMLPGTIGQLPLRLSFLIRLAELARCAWWVAGARGRPAGLNLPMR